MRKFNDWNVSYSAISFFEKTLRGHVKVRSFKRLQDILFKIRLTSDLEMNALLVDEYCLGLAAIHRALSEFPGVEYIVTCSNWNGYTREAKIYGKTNKLGIFILGEFLRALNSKDPKKYVQKDEKGKAIYHFRSA